MIRLLPILALVALAQTARADTPAPFEARETAHVRGKGHWSVGLFNPLRYSLTDKVELEAHPVFFFVAPHLTARVEHLKKGGWTLTGEYSLSVPTPGMRLMKGFFFPAWETSGDNVGWFLVPRVGVLASYGAPEGRVYTVRVEGALGLGLGKNAATPIDSAWTPLNLLLAPALTGHLLRAGVAYDRPLHARIRAKLEANVYHTGGAPEGYAELSRWITSVHAGVDFRLTERVRLTAGVFWFNADQGRKDEGEVTSTPRPRQLQPVRSNDFLPSIDVIWMR